MGESKKRKGSKAPKHHKKKSSRRERSRSKSRRKASSPSPAVAATAKPDVESPGVCIARDSESTQLKGSSKDVDATQCKSVEPVARSRSRSQSWSPVRREEESSEADSFWAQQASAWVSNRTSDKGVAGLMTLIATQAAVQMASSVKSHAGSAKAPPPPPPPPPPCIDDKTQGGAPHFPPFGFSAVLPSQPSGVPPVGLPVPPPPPPGTGPHHIPLVAASVGLSGHDGANFPFVPPADASSLCGFGSTFDSGSGSAVPFRGPGFKDASNSSQPKSKTIPQWLRDVVCEANSQKKESESGGATEPEKGQLLTPSPKTGSPREASPETAKENTPVTDPAMLLEEIKSVVTDILAEVSDEIFSEAACEAISNQRRKQRIACKTTIGLKLQGAAPLSQTKQNAASSDGVHSVTTVDSAVGGSKKPADETKSAGVLNRLAGSLGAYRCPVNATPPPPGVFEITIFEDGLELTRVPFNGTHILFGNSSKLANVIDQHASVAGQQCAIYYSTKQLHQQGGCFFIVPLGGTTVLLPNNRVPFLPETIKADLAASKSRRSVKSYISKHKAKWISWEPDSDCGVVLNAGDQRLALNEQRVRISKTSNHLFKASVDVSLVAEGKAKDRTDSRKGHDKRRRRRSRDRRGRERTGSSASRVRSRKRSRSFSSSEERRHSSPSCSLSSPKGSSPERQDARGRSSSRSSGCMESRSISSASARSASRDSSRPSSHAEVVMPRKTLSDKEETSSFRGSDRNSSISCSRSGSRSREGRGRNTHRRRGKRSSSTESDSSCSSRSHNESPRKRIGQVDDRQIHSGSESRFSSSSVASKSQTRRSQRSVSSADSNPSSSESRTSRSPSSLAARNLKSDAEKSVESDGRLSSSRSRSESRESETAEEDRRGNSSQSRSLSPESARSSVRRGSASRGRSSAQSSRRSSCRSVERDLKRPSQSRDSANGRRSTSSSLCSENASVRSSSAGDDASNASSTTSKSHRSENRRSVSASRTSRSPVSESADLSDIDPSEQKRPHSISSSSRRCSSAVSESSAEESKSSSESRASSKVSNYSLIRKPEEEDLERSCSLGRRRERRSPRSQSRSGSGSVDSASSKRLDRNMHSVSSVASSSSSQRSEVSKVCGRSARGRDSSSSASRQSSRRTSSEVSSGSDNESPDSRVNGHEPATSRRSISNDSAGSRTVTRKVDAPKQASVDKDHRSTKGKKDRSDVSGKKGKGSSGTRRTGREADAEPKRHWIPSVVEVSDAESSSAERRSRSKRESDEYGESGKDVPKARVGLEKTEAELPLCGKRDTGDKKDKGHLGSARSRIKKGTKEPREKASGCPRRAEGRRVRESAREKPHASTRDVSSSSARADKLGNAIEAFNKQTPKEIKNASGKFDPNNSSKKSKKEDLPLNSRSRKRSHVDVSDGDGSVRDTKKAKLLTEKAVDSPLVKHSEQKAADKKTLRAKRDKDRKMKSSRSRNAN